MTPELTVLALAAILQFAQISLAGWAMNRDAGVEWNAAFFTIAVVVVTLSGAANAVSIDEKTVVSSIGGRGRAGGPAAVVDGSLEPGPRKQGQGLGPRRLQPC
jgi:hypothetical protein